MFQRIALLFLCLLSISTYATDYTWNGSISNDWDTPGNWGPSGVPGSSDNVTFSDPPTTYFPSLNISEIVQNITFNGNFSPFTINGAGITVQNISSNSGTNIFNNTLEVGASLTISSGVLSLTNDVTFLSLITSVNGPGVLELGGQNQWEFNGLQVNFANVKLQSLGALGSAGKYPLGISLANSSIFIEINDFVFPVSASTFLLLDVNLIDVQDNNIATIPNNLAGAGSILLVKGGNGTLLLTGANTYAGGTAVSAGVLQGDSTGIQGDIVISSGANVTFDQTAVGPAYSGSMSGAGSVTKNGSATLIFSGNNTYSGLTTVGAGTLQAASTTAFSQNSAFSIASGATLSLVSFNNTVGRLSGPIGSTVDLGTATLTINNGNNQTFAGLVQGSGGLTLNSETFFLNGLTNTYSGNTTINTGAILNIISDSNLGMSTLIINNGGTLQAGATFTLARDVTFSSGFGNIDTNGYNLTMSGLISGGGGLNKMGAGTLFLTSTNPNTYFGGTIITEGTINILNSTSLSSGLVTINNGATLQSGADGINLANTLSLNGTTNIDTNTNSFTLSGTIGGSGLLNKIGEGTLILTGGNSYSGGTTVNAGTLVISSDNNLGTGALSMFGGATLSAAGPFSLTQSRPVFLGSGTVTIDSNGNNIAIDGPISGPGLLLKTNSGILTLTGANSYTGGTTIQGGALNIASDGNLGATSGSVTIDGGTTLQSGGNFYLSPDRTVNLSSGIATIDTVAFNPTIAGPIVGPGSLKKIGTGTLTLLGANSYSGGTQESEGTLQGNTTSLQGNIDISSGSALVFNQKTSGTYSGTLSGSGSLLFFGGGAVTVSGMSPTFNGPTTISGNSTLVINGSLAASPTSLESGSTITGTGTIGPLTVAGRVIPGMDGVGTLTVNGDISFIVSGTLVTNMIPTGNGMLAVNGTANLANSISEIVLGPGFYGITGVRTILTAGSVNGIFANLILDPRLKGFLIYNPNSVQLFFEIVNPFFEFPFANANERAVGNNLDALIAAEQASSDIFSAIDSLKNSSIDEINNALNQLHPAALSAYAELQVELGGQLLSMFHRKPTFCCNCYEDFRLWIEPFGNWLHEKNQGMQIGFHATTRGIAVGTDYQFLDSWTLGIGGAYSLTDMRWSQYRSYGYVESGYLAFYNDFYVGNFFLGFSGYAGKDRFDNIRKIHFSTIDRQAKSHFHGLEMGAQLTSAYYFGTRSIQLYPYATADFLYLKNSSFSESGANSLDLEVNSYRSSTLRAEAGGAFSFVDRNMDETICIAPLFSMGYVLELPLHRDHFHARFAGASIPFTTTGWHQAWQLLNLKVSLDITYRCFSLRSSYGADISPEGDSPFFNQRANFNMSFSF